MMAGGLGRTVDEALKSKWLALTSKVYLVLGMSPLAVNTLLLRPVLPSTPPFWSLGESIG